MSEDSSMYLSSCFDKELRKLIDDHDIRVEIHKLIDDEISEMCNDCNYKRKCDQ